MGEWGNRGRALPEHHGGQGRTVLSVLPASMALRLGASWLCLRVSEGPHAEPCGDLGPQPTVSLGLCRTSVRHWRSAGWALIPRRPRCRPSLWDSLPFDLTPPSSAGEGLWAVP